MQGIRFIAAGVACLLSLAMVACSDHRDELGNTNIGLTPAALSTPEPVPTQAPLSRTDRVVTESCDEDTGAPCLAIDANPGEDGTQRTRDVETGEQFTVDVIVHGIPEDSRGLGTFQLTLTYDRALLGASAPRPSAAVVEQGSECGIFEPSGDIGDDDGFADGNPDTGDALLACVLVATPQSPAGPTGSVALGSFEFEALSARTATLALVLSQVNANERQAPPLVDCSPGAPVPGGGCQDATVEIE